MKDGIYWVFEKPQRQTIVTVNDVVSEDERLNLIEWGRDKFEPIPMFDGQLHPELKNTTDVFVPFDEFEWLYKRVEKLITYVNEKNFQFSIDKMQRLMLVKYEVGQFMAIHTDSPINTNRKISCPISLTQQGLDFEGGDLIIYDGNRPITPANGIHKIELVRGRATLYPSYLLHEVTPVTKGVRYMLGTWAHGPTSFT